MRRYIFSIILVFASFPAFATSAGLTVGVKQNSYVSDLSGVKEKDGLGYSLGGFAVMDINEMLKFRTGLAFNQRIYGAESGTSDVTYTVNYLDIPVTLQYNVTDMVGLFGGINLGVKASASCSGDNCDVDDADPKSTVTPIVLGANFRTSAEMGFEFYLERGSGEILKDVKEYSAIGANFFYIFE